MSTKSISSATNASQAPSFAELGEGLRRIGEEMASAAAAAQCELEEWLSVWKASK